LQDETSDQQLARHAKQWETVTPVLATLGVPACRLSPHWFKLPLRLRNAIWAAYQPGQEASMDVSDDYFKAVDEVQKWIKENG
jgi:hypothetical protein